MKIFLATKNQDKIKEFEQILSNLQVELVTCMDIDIPDVKGGRLRLHALWLHDTPRGNATS